MKPIKYAIVLVVLLTTFVRADYVWSGEPEWLLWGNLEHISYDQERHIWINQNPAIERWRWLGSPEDVAKNTADECVPEKKKIVVVLKSWTAKLENFYFLAVIGTSSGSKRIRPFFVHCDHDAVIDDRFDTLMMPNGTVASLQAVNEGLRMEYPCLLPGTAIDESYMAPDIKNKREFLLAYLREQIDKALSAGEEPVVYCTLLSYNGENTLGLLRELKSRYEDRVRTGIGGQLVRVSPKTYQSMDFVDQVGVGDAEAILEPMLVDRMPFVQGWIGSDDSYAGFSYEGYLGLKERLEEMSRLEFGPFFGFRQVVLESVRGCSWAYQFGRACEMCSLQSVISKPRFRDFAVAFAQENDLAEELGANWIFDVSNQWIPVMGEKKQVVWLKSYLEAKQKLSRHNINKYVYLTADSITKETAPLIRAAGVRVSYIGFDGWNTETRKALNKPQVDPRKTLEACRQNDIYARLGIVIGSGLTKENIRELPDFAESLMAEYKGTILSWGNFLQIILPGSKVWQNFEEEARRHNWLEAVGLYDSFYQNGFLSWPDQERMTELYIRLVQRADYEAVVAARDEVDRIVRPHAIPITLRDGGRLNRT